MFPLVETTIAFAAVMLVASLCVTAIAQVVQSRMHLRGRVLAEMLVTLVRTHREARGLERVAGLEEAFVERVLTHRLLHTPATIAAARGDAHALARQVDYLDGKDLVDLVRNDVAMAPDGEIAEAIEDVDAFAAFVARWYATIGATASQYFKRRMRAITFVTSAVIVIASNLDGLELINGIHRDRMTHDALSSELYVLQGTIERLDSSDASKREAELSHEVARLSALVDEGSAGVGWRSPRVEHRLCILRRTCDVPATVAVAEIALWIGGLVFSWMMLSLGAPFWANTLGRLVSLKNEVQKLKTESESNDR